MEGAGTKPSVTVGSKAGAKLATRPPMKALLNGSARSTVNMLCLRWGARWLQML